MNDIFHELVKAFSQAAVNCIEFAERISNAAENLRELEQLAEIAIYPVGYTPIEYARQLQSRDYIQNVIYSLADRNRCSQYECRYIPCSHASCGVMIWKKGRVVRRKR